MYTTGCLPVGQRRRPYIDWNVDGLPLLPATLLKAGLTLSEGLALLAEQHPSKQWQALLQSLAHDLEQGIAFSNALLP